jgi:hypothetical protein
MCKSGKFSVSAFSRWRSCQRTFEMSPTARGPARGHPNWTTKGDENDDLRGIPWYTTPAPLCFPRLIQHKMLWGDAGIQNHHISGRISCFLKLFGLRGIYQQKDHVQNVIFVESDQMHPTLLIHRQESWISVTWALFKIRIRVGWSYGVLPNESEKGRQRLLNTAQMGFHIEFTEFGWRILHHFQSHHFPFI